MLVDAACMGGVAKIAMTAKKMGCVINESN